MKSQANALTAVLKNWQDVENAIDIYANSAGSALRENEIYLDSWEAKSNAVSVTWNLISFKKKFQASLTKPNFSLI